MDSDVNKNAEKYYLTQVDKEPQSIYCHHDLMGELLIPTHSHDKAQFLYTEGGVVYVKTQTKTYFLPARHFIWIPANVAHSIHPSSTNVIMRNLYFPVDKSDADFYKQEGIYPVNDLLLQMILFTNRWKGNIMKKDKQHYTIALAFKALLLEIGPMELPLALPFPQDERLKKVVEYVGKYLHEDIAFSKIAKHFGFSERSLSRLFQKDLDMSFIQYLTIQRILKAIELLLEHRTPVSEVALMVGYNSIPSFSNTFYRLMGQRPSEYLKTEGVLKKS
ncbi:AraC family transcriptional regulator [Flavobacterium sp. '19STA2R22 D10 B1']|uniref:AraC family transcriptional regulator n=1 Tax=Flavobacterium aerium TaxID=3037261 RepID=UPI00278C05C1|nr:AraC family transcriptional regulator [Flavobacterium sp. '19STA2R22 D10 B1']